MTEAAAVRAPRLPREERRQQVLAAALTVFSTSGYHAASMDEIAEEAGVSKPVLYQHFPGKLELYLELLDSGLQDLLAAARMALASTSDNALRGRAMVDAFLTFAVAPDSAFRLVFESDMANEDAVRERVAVANQELERMTAEVIAEDTGLSEQEALLLAAGMQGLLQGSARRWLRAGESRIPLEEASDLISSLGWRGISGFPLTHPPQAE